jgi:hypothetical protein
MSGATVFALRRPDMANDKAIAAAAGSGCRARRDDREVELRRAGQVVQRLQYGQVLGGLGALGQACGQQAGQLRASARP